jgi:hypothetical protein
LAIAQPTATRAAVSSNIPAAGHFGAPSSIPTSSVRTIWAFPAMAWPMCRVAIVTTAARLSASASSRLRSKSAVVRAARSRASMACSRIVAVRLLIVSATRSMTAKVKK